MKIGLRTLKTAFGAGFALWLAQFVGLEFYATAATITILCIEKTKKKSVSTAANRLLACTISLLLSWFLFEKLGYSPITFSLIIVFLIPVLIQLHLEKGFITSVVIPVHLYSMQNVNWEIIQNEFFTILIGISIAMVLNMFMPSYGKELLTLKEQIELSYQKVIFEFARHLDLDSEKWDKKELNELPRLLEKANDLSMDSAENSFTKDRMVIHLYFKMRGKQCEILTRMSPIIDSLSKDMPQRHMFASFLYQISGSISAKNESAEFLKQLKNERSKMDELPLPRTREELRNRALLFLLTNEMEMYLQTKLNYHEEIEFLNSKTESI